MKIMRMLLAVLTIVLLAGVALALPPQQSVHEVRNMLTTSPTPVALLDVRTPGEYAGGHIAGSLLYNFNGDDFERKLALLPKNYTYVVYGETNHRSKRAATMMRGMGFSVLHMDGGFKEWKRAGLPVAK